MGTRNQEIQELAVTFDEPRVVKEIPKVVQTASKIVIKEMIDNPIHKTVIVKTNIGEILLWGSRAYDTIGDWTNAMVLNRINELYPATTSEK